MKIGIFGVGRLGKIHLECLKHTPFQIVGIFDPDDRKANQVSAHYNIPKFPDEESLMNASDAVDITASSTAHYHLGMKAVNLGKHIFVEKPVTSSFVEAKMLKAKLDQNRKVFQVGHVERYNPALRSLKDLKIQPLFIEAHRLSSFSHRSSDVSVILDLMIHDLDLTLNMVNQEVKDIQATGVNVVNNTPDICNARITFSGGCVANLTASRISMKNMRKFRVFQNDAYISMDLLKNKSQIITLKDHSNEEGAIPMETQQGKKYIKISSPAIDKTNAIVEELNDFYISILRGTPPIVGFDDGYQALEIATMIEDKLKNI